MADKKSGGKDTRLRGRWLLLARAAWLLISALTLSLFLIGIPAEYAAQLQAAREKFQPALAQVGLSAPFFAGYRTALDVTEAVLFALTGIFIFWRKSDDWMVMLVSIANITFGALFVPTLVRLMETSPQLSLPIAFVRAAGLFSSLVVFYYLFPDGRFVPGWLRWFGVTWGLFALVWLIFPSTPFNLIYLETWFNSLAYSFLLFLFWYGTGAAAQIYRYRHVSNALQRQQTKWVVFGTTMAFVGFLLYHLVLVMLPAQDEGVPRLLHILFGVPLYHLLVLAAPVCVGLSILRFRLWDIDFLINRSLVYGLLSGLLVIVYMVSVLVFSLLFRGINGGQPGQLATILATLMIAVLFSPLRERVQQVIDRRFYRRKVDAVRLLASFGETVRDEVDLSRLNEEFLGVVRDMLLPSHAALWLITPTLPDQPVEEDKPVAQKQDITWSEIRNPHSE